MARRSLRTKLFLATGLLITGFTVVAIAGITQLLDRAGRERVAELLETGRTSVVRFQTLRQQLLETTASACAAAPHLKSTLDIPGLDHATALDQARDIQRAVQASFVVVADHRDAVLGDTLRPRRHGHSLTLSDGLRRVHGVPYQIATAPIVAGERLLGTLVLGERLGAAMTDEVHRVTGLDVTLIGHDRVMAHSWRTNAEFDSEANARSIARLAHVEDDVMALELGGRPCFATTLFIAERTQLVLSYAAEDMRHLHRNIWLMVLAGAVIITVVGLWSCHVLARKIAQPIQGLVDASGQLARGDLAVRVPSSDTDEFDRLATSFNGMAARIEQLLAEVRDKAAVLERQKAELEATNAAKSQFLTTASHELRTPVTNILSFAEILTGLDADEPIETRTEFAGVIQSESTRLTRLIDQIMELAKLDAGMVQWSLDDIDLREMVEEVATSKTWCRGERELRLELPGAALPYTGDRKRLSRVLHSVLDNADKFSPDGAPVTVRLRTAGATPILEVIDAGPGIASAEDRERIFERFQQGGDLLIAKPEGAGLGLPICREILRMHGATITCRPVEGGHGALFRIRLPLPTGGRDDRPIAHAVAAAMPAAASR